MINKKGQIREVVSVVVVIFLLAFIIKVLNPFLKLISSGNIASSPDALANALIPLIIFAIFFEFIRRFFR